MRRTTYAVAGTITAALSISALMITSATASPLSPHRTRAAIALDSGAVVAHRDKTGRVTALSAQPGHPLAAPSVGASGSTSGDGGGAAKIARKNVNDFAHVFGITHPATDLKQVSAVSAGTGSIVRFQQTHNDLPVIGGQLVVAQDAAGGLIGIDGEASTDTAAATRASVSVTSAAATAKQATAAATKRAATGLVTSTPTLSYYDPALLGNSDGLAARPVFQVTVTSPQDPAIDEYVLIDARTGSVALAFSQDDAAHRTPKTQAAASSPAAAAATAFTATVSVCDFKDVSNVDETCAKPVSGAGSSTVSDVANAYNDTGLINNFYNSVLGRKGIDGANMPVVSTVRYCPDDADCPYANSYWDGTQMAFGDGFPSAPDVVAHEYTHGVTQYTSGLLYYYQSGSINESMSDVMGELFDQYNGTDTNGQWMFGERLPAGWQRNMADPTQSSLGAQPDSMSSALWSTDAFDNGGVHTDSGVGNKLAYLAAQGGTFNGVAVQGIAHDGTADPNMIQKMGKIWLTADELLTPAADYADLGNAVETACTTLLTAKTDGITAADCTSVTNAVAATQLESTTSSHLPAQTVDCSTGLTAGTVFSDTFDRTTGIGSTWTNAGDAEINNYAAPSVAAGSQLYLPEPTGEVKPSTPYMATAAMTLSKAHGSYLYFQHLDSLDWLDGSSDGSPSYYTEGMYVEAQVGTSTAWTPVTGTWVNGPTKTVTKSSIDSDGTLEIGSAYPGTAFAGDSQGWTSSRVALPTTWEGQSVKFRFRLQTDGYDWYTASYGEFLDNVSVNTCVKAPLAASTVKMAGYHGQATMTWGPASTNGGSAISSYAVYKSDNGGAYTRTATLAATARSYTYTGLVNGHDYKFEIRAENTDAVYGPMTSFSLLGTSQSLKASATKIAKGKSATVSGVLTRATARTGMSGRSVVLYQRKHGTTAWTTVGTVTTPSTGAYSFTVKPTQTEDYYVHYSDGSGSYIGTTSPVVTITVS